jgi:hypothetical protein
MTVPFRLDPEPVERPAQQDPFLEFESERPSRNLPGAQETAGPAEEVQRPPFLAPPSDRMSSVRHESAAINPTVAFAVGVAGLVTAVVGYYQMGQLLADRTQPPPVQAAASAATGPSVSGLPAAGRLEIATDPAGATVSVDGKAHGVTPVTLADVAPGRHVIVLTRGRSTVTRTVELTAGGTAVVAAMLAAPAPVPTPARPAAPTSAPSLPSNAGWVTFDSPIELRILDRGRARGSTRDRLSLNEGTHDLELISDIYEVRQSVLARVGAGRGTRIPVSLPSGSLSINALPWADVWVDGSPVGTTPLANLQLKVGTHQVLLRHPTLGERQQAVVVKAVTPARLGVNLNR